MLLVSKCRLNPRVHPLMKGDTNIGRTLTGVIVRLVYAVAQFTRARSYRGRTRPTLKNLVQFSINMTALTWKP